MSCGKKIPVVLIFGPTAVGKTQLLSSPVFKKTEIINADSMQVYRGMDIGTAKPEPEFLKKVKHHLIDIREPSEQFTAGNFVNLADALAKDIYKRNLLPVVCGGTGFYFKNFIYGLPETPKSNEKTRKELQSALDNNGVEALYHKLSEVDLPSAERINKNDSYRIMRALEVYYSSGKPLSEYKIPIEQREEYSFYVIGLRRERAELYKRINQRVDLMFEQGLYSEIKRLENLGFTENDPGIKSIGYKEFFQRKNQDFEKDEIKEQIKKNSRRYAKRQITWFRQLESINWFSPNDVENITKAIKDFAASYLPLSF